MDLNRKESEDLLEWLKKSDLSEESGLDSQVQKIIDERRRRRRRKNAVIKFFQILLLVLLSGVLAGGLASRLYDSYGPPSETREESSAEKASEEPETLAIVVSEESTTAQFELNTEAWEEILGLDGFRELLDKGELTARGVIQRYVRQEGGRLRDYPERIVNLLANNHETLEFVLNYPAKKEKTQTFSRKEFEHLSHVPLLIQWDERWGYHIYGSNVMGLTGCGPTSLSMVAMYLLQDPTMTPEWMADFSEENGYYVKGSGSAWALVERGARKLGLRAREISISRINIEDKLREGVPLIAVVGPGDFTDNGHFLVMTGMEDDKIRLNDPNSYIRSEKRWDFDELESQLRVVWALRKADDEEYDD